MQKRMNGLEGQEQRQTPGFPQQQQQRAAPPLYRPAALKQCVENCESFLAQRFMDVLRILVHFH